MELPAFSIAFSRLGYACDQLTHPDEVVKRLKRAHGQMKRIIDMLEYERESLEVA